MARERFFNKSTLLNMPQVDFFCPRVGRPIRRGNVRLIILFPVGGPENERGSIAFSFLIERDGSGAVMSLSMFS